MEARDPRPQGRALHRRQLRAARWAGVLPDVRPAGARGRQVLRRVRRAVAADPRRAGASARRAPSSPAPMRRAARAGRQVLREVRPAAGRGGRAGREVSEVRLSRQTRVWITKRWPMRYQLRFRPLSRPRPAPSAPRSTSSACSTRLPEPAGDPAASSPTTPTHSRPWSHVLASSQFLTEILLRNPGYLALLCGPQRAGPDQVGWAGCARGAQRHRPVPDRRERRS